MLVKQKDNRDADIQELNRLLGGNLTAKQRFMVERELKCLQSGERNEQNSAYYLDFRYKDSKNWAVIHDLRIEHRGRVAQIDHLLINRFLDIFVLESKNYYYGIKVTQEGEFLVWNGKTYQAIESPIEQNNRHVQALQMAVEDRNLGPKRLGFAIPINYRNIVLLSPTSKIIRPDAAPFDLSAVQKADAFASFIEKEMDKKSIIEAPKIIGSDTLQEFGEKLARLHRPGSFDYAAKFGIQAVTMQAKSPSAVAQSIAPVTSTQPGQPVCRECKGANLSIQYGKFGYYFKCSDCDANTPIKIGCGKDGHKERIRKDGLNFYRECPDCGSSSLYFTNKP
ncbi:nuclease-related domain-containing protein [Trichlorobacter lovleyi]|uniref:nuclease-related domain-containing protein n=1 Tax=Trichlorobacter lovleyi TaxID=313985 RepID=UPI0023F1B1C2|nr:NERD domain-containing protein [Trichlorobacter lovleyi]